MIGRTVAHLGKLDAAFNNAGLQSIAVEAADTAREDFYRVIRSIFVVCGAA
jgi:NAD(P)-dependent dehydrogenase (short-subunit alcohol dehydrogenase family)